MSSIFQPAQYQEEISRIVDDVFRVMFADNPKRVEESPQHGYDYTASVGFCGDWKGALLVRCGVATAESFARKLLKTPRVFSEDISDAMGEVANMIGGNLKSVLPPGVALSVPCVALGDQGVRICGEHEGKTSLFEGADGQFEVTLIRMLPDASEGI